MKIKLLILAILFLWELIFPINLYKKNEKFVFNKNYLEQKVQTDFKINPYFYQKEYLMPNGKYVGELTQGYKEGVIPAPIHQIFEKYSNKNQMISMWIVLSNWGLYSYGNNPWGLELNSVKTIMPTFPNTSVVLTKKYKYITTKDSSFYQKTFVKLASFSSLEEGAEIFSKLYASGIYAEGQLIETFNKVETNIDKIKNVKETIDSNKVKLFKSDTISVNDSVFVVTKKDITDYQKIYVPNILLIGYLFYLFFNLKIINKND